MSLAIQLWRQLQLRVERWGRREGIDGGVRAVVLYAATPFPLG